MKKYFGDIRNLIILVLIVVILLLRQCSGDGGEITPSEPTIVTKVETKYDTITIDKKVYVPKWKTKIVTQVDSILVNTPIDTLEVLKDYYAKNVFVDKIELDSLGFVTITDTIWKNTLFNRLVESEIIIPTTTVTQTEYINPREFYIGFGLNGTSKQFNYVGGSILYRTRKKQAFGLGIGLNDQFQPIISTQFLWKLGKK
jgi:hypothetical protein|tara:strand:+ start:121 stop:720 length:600 start_codon:yes stop_codon:yes gene_type:complete